MFRVWINTRWVENIPADEALVYKEEGHFVQRMDLPYSTPPLTDNKSSAPKTVVNETFLTADQLSASLMLSRIYLGTRPEDRAKFEKDLVLRSRNGDVYIAFENGYEGHVYPDGEIALIAPNAEHGKMFKSMEQFTVYYLAKFW